MMMDAFHDDNMTAATRMRQLSTASEVKWTASAARDSFALARGQHCSRDLRI